MATASGRGLTLHYTTLRWGCARQLGRTDQTHHLSDGYRHEESRVHARAAMCLHCQTSSASLSAKLTRTAHQPVANTNTHAKVRQETQHTQYSSTPSTWENALDHSPTGCKVATANKVVCHRDGGVQNQRKCISKRRINAAGLKSKCHGQKDGRPPFHHPNGLMR